MRRAISGFAGGLIRLLCAALNAAARAAHFMPPVRIRPRHCGVIKFFEMSATAKWRVSKAEIQESPLN